MKLPQKWNSYSRSSSKAMVWQGICRWWTSSRVMARTCSVCPSARCPASAMQSHGMVGNRRRDGTARAPRCKRKKVKTLSPTLGIAGESPQHTEDLQRKARPEGERPNNRPQKLLLSIPWKKEDRIFRSFALMIYICNWAKIIAENVDNYMLPT